MPISIDRDELQRLVRSEQAQLVEVLPVDEYEDEHLPGAINLPLKALDRETTSQLDRERPVIVYCYDTQWDTSPRAAWRLESLGFTHVYHYAAGKADWGSFGLPLEGQRHSGTRVGAYLQTDVPTCSLEESLPEVCERVRAAGWDTCFVVNEQRIVLGRLGRAALARGDGTSIEEAMTAGPSTVRPSLDLAAALERMRSQNLTNLPVTRSDGLLLGLIGREDAGRAIETL
jgi:rhodanese-related sulfurtransferase/CBS domain-containing protein